MSGIGHIIKRIRESKRLTQYYVATELGISQPAFAKIESEQAKLTIQKRCGQNSLDSYRFVCFPLVSDCFQKRQ